MGAWGRNYTRISATDCPRICNCDTEVHTPRHGGTYTYEVDLRLRERDQVGGQRLQLHCVRHTCSFLLVRSVASGLGGGGVVGCEGGRVV